jgi:hypothetical protein
MMAIPSDLVYQQRYREIYRPVAMISFARQREKSKQNRWSTALFNAMTRNAARKQRRHIGI